MMVERNTNSVISSIVIKIGISSATVLVIFHCLRKLFPSKFKQIQRWLFTQIAVQYSAKQIGESLAPFKSKLFSNLTVKDVKILEIGIGQGANLAYYPNGTKLYSVEPNPYFELYFNENASKFPGIKVENFSRGTAEDMSTIDDSTIDVVVSTHVLCSVTNIEKCLSEILRVLVPGGKFYYIEHISYGSNSSVKRLIQHLCQPFWQVFSDGCKLTRDPTIIMNNIHLTDSTGKYNLSIIQEDVVLVPGVYTVIKPHVIGIRCKEANV